MNFIPAKWFYRRKDALNMTGEKRHKQFRRQLSHERKMYLEALHEADIYRNIALLNLKTGISHLIKADPEEMEYLDLLDETNRKEFAYDEWMRRSTRELVHPDYSEAFATRFNIESLREKISSDEPRQTMVYKCRSRVGGEYRWVQAEYVARKQDEISNEVLCYVSDINDRWIEAEKERKDLKEKCRRAERGNHIKTEFLEHSSHNLRVAANSIAGMSQLALRTLDLRQLDMTRHYLSLVNGMVNGMMSFLSDVVDITYVQTKGLILAHECFDIHELMMECCEYAHYLEEDRQISFVRTGEFKGYYLGDEKRLRLVMYNVLENAVKYNRIGGEVRVRSEQIFGRGAADTFIIRVTDSGSGISAEQQKELFEPFSRGKQKAGNSQSGIGIGLSIAKYVLGAMKGSIDIKSEPGLGTEVTMRFALQRGNVNQMAKIS